MIELVKFELKKIFEKKIIYLLALGVALFIVLPGASSFGNREQMKAFATEFEGDKYTVEKFQEEMKTVDKKIENEEELTDRESFIREYMVYSYPRSNEASYFVLEGKYTHSEIKEELNKLEQGTYKYNVFKQADEMISKLPKVEYKYTGAWNSMNDFNVAGTMKLMLLVLGLAGIFSSEYAENTAQLLLSTKNGRRKVTGAKILAGVIYACSVFVFVSVLYTIEPMIVGLENGNLPLRNLVKFSGTPYDITIIQYYIVTLGISFVGTIIFALAIMLVSLLVKNNMISMATGLGLYFIPSLLIGLPLPEMIQNFINRLSFAELLRAATVFDEYVTFNIFGNAVLYPYMIVITMIVLLMVGLIAIYKFGKSQRLC
ncbi:hypothetical protein [Clostridium sp.]|uniref:ABC transporter permease n=1 Tax=Clostridium sp. TaxID=1506 RepID=UPI003217892A